jgi:hypothetical protein
MVKIAVAMKAALANQKSALIFQPSRLEKTKWRVSMPRVALPRSMTNC